MPLAIVATSVRKGIGDILGSLLVVIVTGAMLGKLVVSSGAAERIAFVLVARFGRTRIPWAMATTGLLVGIPLFYGVGFVLMVPIIFTIVARYRLPAIAAGLPALAAMSVAHGLLPPHPAPHGTRCTVGCQHWAHAALWIHDRDSRDRHCRSIVFTNTRWNRF